MEGTRAPAPAKLALRELLASRTISLLEEDASSLAESGWCVHNRR